MKHVTLAIIFFSLFGMTSCLNISIQSGPGETVTREPQAVRRYGQVIKVKPEMIQRYRELHADPWPSVLKMIRECNIQNYSIYLQDTLLFAYFEYTGSDFQADMQKMAQDSTTQAWWKETDPCQESLSKDGQSWWLNMEEVFHTD
jgi:L-rhamnose mutarotase